MSDASMPFHPAIDEPSKAWPLSNLSCVNCFDGTVTCCSLPRVSVKRRSTNLTSLSLIIFSTSAGVVMQGLLEGTGVNADAASRKSSACQRARSMPHVGALQASGLVQFFPETHRNGNPYAPL